MKNRIFLLTKVYTVVYTIRREELMIMLTAKLFTNGSSQAVRLPKEFRFNGTEVYVQKVGSSVMLVPKDKAWETFMEGINEFSDDYLEKAEERPANMQSPEEREKL